MDPGSKGEVSWSGSRSVLTCPFESRTLRAVSVCLPINKGVKVGDSSGCGFTYPVVRSPVPVPWACLDTGPPRVGSVSYSQTEEVRRSYVFLRVTPPVTI